jgi:hypothetical protein
VAAREGTPSRYTRVGARKRIEQVFNAAVLEILAPIELSICASPSSSAKTTIRPQSPSSARPSANWILAGSKPATLPSWRAAAYAALGETLGTALPVFGYQDLFEEISMYYWDGEIDDEGARRSLAAYQGLSAEEIEEQTLL